MKHNSKLVTLSAVVLTSLLLSLVMPGNVFADDPTPPPVTTEEAPTEAAPTVPPPADAVPTEPPPTEESPIDGVPTDALPTEPPLTDEAPADGLVEAPPPEDPVIDGELTTETSLVEEAPVLSEIVASASEAGVTLTDESGAPLEMGTLAAAETLVTGDPWLVYDGTTYNFFETGGCPGGVSSTCNESSDPIQAALDFVYNGGGAARMPTAESYTDPALGTISIYPIHIQAGTYVGQWAILSDNLTLLGDAGDTAVPGPGAQAPILSGTTCVPSDTEDCSGAGERAAGTGLEVDATGVTLIGLILQNYDVAVSLMASGQASFTAENNTIRNNGIGIYNENSVPKVDLHYNIFTDNRYAIKNVVAGGSQYINAQYNYWGCEAGPVVERSYTTTEGTGQDKYVVQHTEYYQWDAGGPGAQLAGFDPDAEDCEVLFGDKDEHWDHSKAGDWAPYKIILDPLAPLQGPFCGDGAVDTGEACDPPGSTIDEHHICSDTCQSQYVPYCGDGTVDTGEACDPPGSTIDAHHICSATCQSQYVPWCGDGVKDPGEACDPNATPTGAPDHYICNANCTTTYVPWCGDGVKDPGEACDPNATPTGAPDHYICNANCTTTYVPWCGDGKVNQGSEECDDGGASATCTARCTKIGDGPTPVPPTILGGLIPVTGGASAIAAGWAHTCAITPQHDVQCWGDNDFGQLGNGNNTASNVPVDVVGLNGGTRIVAGANHTCLLDGTAVWCWGQNDKGQLGDGTTTNRNAPVQVLTGASSLTAGADYTCAGLWTGGVMCWGNNASGQLGDGTKISHNTPTLASLLQNVHEVDGGQQQTCALTASGQISCWSGGLLPVTGGAAEIHRDVSVNRFDDVIVAVNPEGAPVMIDSSGSKTISEVSGVVDIDGGQGHVCALLAGGSVKCWGANSYGQLGNNSTTESQKPVNVSALGGASLLGVGRNHTCVIVTATPTSTVIQCWGLNGDGQLGNASNTNSSVPVYVKD